MECGRATTFISCPWPAKAPLNPSTSEDINTNIWWAAGMINDFPPKLVTVLHNRKCPRIDKYVTHAGKGRDWLCMLATTASRLHTRIHANIQNAAMFTWSARATSNKKERGISPRVVRGKGENCHGANPSRKQHKREFIAIWRPTEFSDPHTSSFVPPLNCTFHKSRASARVRLDIFITKWHILLLRIARGNVFGTCHEPSKSQFASRYLRSYLYSWTICPWIDASRVSPMSVDYPITSRQQINYNLRQTPCSKLSCSRHLYTPK